MPQLGPLELIIIFVIFMIFFGAGKLGDLGGALRRGIINFKQHAGWEDSEKKDQSRPAGP
jgi:sec-independent protein translocase protein TatA